MAEDDKGGPIPVEDLTKPARLTAAQHAARLATVEDYLFRQLKDHGQIERELGEQWKVTDRQVRRYITKCYEIARRRAAQTPDGFITREKLRHGLVDTYNAARKDGAHSAAVMALDRLGRLYGLFPDMIRVQHEGEIEHKGTVEVSPAHLHQDLGPDLRRLSDEELDALERIDRKLLAATSTFPRAAAAAGDGGEGAAEPPGVCPPGVADPGTGDGDDP